MAMESKLKELFGPNLSDFGELGISLLIYYAMMETPFIAIQIIRETKGGDDGECRARRRTTVGWRPPRTTTQPCAHQRAELVFLFVWIAIVWHLFLKC